MTMLPMDPAFGGGLAGQMPLNLDPRLTQLPQMQGGMFGGGKPDWGSAIQAGIGGYLAGRGMPGGAQILSQVHQRQMMAQQQAMEDANYQRHQQDSRNNFIFEQDYRATHPQPHQPGEFENVLMQSGIQPGTPEWRDAMTRKKDISLNPVVMTPYGPMPYSAIMGAQQQAPAKPLTDDDILRMQGGSAASPPATFP